VSWAPGGGAWTFSSDRNLKDRLENVDPESVLEKVSQLPILEWSYKGYPQRHIGAMAQDFHDLFPLNDNDKALNDLDLHGVTLAAIQGLNRKVEEKEARIQEQNSRIQNQSAEITELKARLDRLEHAISGK
jgi:peptidoglycan hydrolase CwlO-like protein